MNTFLWNYAIKDLFRQKTRTLLGVLGIAVSLFLLTSVSFVTDSVSYNFVDFLTLGAGNQDMVISARPQNSSQSNFTQYYDYTTVTPAIREATDEIGEIIPRGYFYTTFVPDNITYDYRWRDSWLCAIDLEFEYSIEFGKFKNLEGNLSLSEGLPANSCIVTPSFAERNDLVSGDIAQIWIGELNNTVNLTVVSTYEHGSKFPMNWEPEIVVDLSWFGELADARNNNTKYDPQFTWVNRVNALILVLANAAEIYDVRDVDGSENYISNIGADILANIGIQEWEIDYPKLQLLFLSEFLTLTMNILFISIGLISMLISGILINGILSTSVEERIKEYGINRVLGARKLYNLKLIIIQGTIISFLGTTVGVLLSAILLRFVGVPIANNRLFMAGFDATLIFVIRPSSILLSYAIGIGVSMAISVIPALKVMRMKIVESINPYRTTDEVYHMQKEGSANVKLIIIGIILSANAGFIYFLIPRIIISFQFGILASVLIITLLVFMIGVSLMAIGFMPILIRLLVKVFEPFNQKLMNIVRITVHRHQRRNMSTSVMFVLSFSFILFTTSMVEIQLKQTGALIQYDMGSDILVRSRDYTLHAATAELADALMGLEGIERVSSVIASSSDLEDIYREENKEFEVRLGDYIDYQNQNIRLYGIDENYVDTLWSQEYVVFSEGDMNQAFAALYNETEMNIIISASLASFLRVHLGDVARLTFTRGTEEEPFICRVVGVAKSMPGMDGRFSESGIGSTFMAGGVLISAQNYIRGMNIPGEEQAYIDKIFVKVQDGYNSTIVANMIEEEFGDDFNLRVGLTSEGIAEAERAFLIVKYLFLAILIGTVLIALFGLITSSYSSILERKREIGIIRTLGLYGSEVERMFLLENMILLLSSSTSGGLIGFLMALGLSENMTLFIQSPRMIAIPWDIIAIIYSVSVITLIIGMKVLMRKLKYQNLIEIFRETL
ncbi:MAG: ABC transporter permease [Promethearchaeota archaeon]